MLRGNEFFKQLPVHQGFAAAQHFWWATFLLMQLTFLVLVRAAQTVGGLMSSDDDFLVLMGPAAVIAAAVPFVLQVLMTFAGCLYAQFACGIRDYRVSAVVCYYASPLLWPIMTVLIAVAVLAPTPLTDWLMDTDPIKLGNLTIPWHLLAFILVAAEVLALLFFWWYRLSWALASVRYANV